jgi:hypothetical protein
MAVLVIFNISLKPDETTINSYVRFLGQSSRSARFAPMPVISSLPSVKFD